MKDRYNPNQVGGAVFLIGLGLIAFLNYWWPGIMFVIAASLLASEWVETDGKLNVSNRRVIGAGIMILIGLVGFIGINWGQLWPIVLILIGLGMLFGRDRLPGMRDNGSAGEAEKSKRKSVTIDEK